MVDVWLIILAVVVPVLVVALNFYILAYYQHPDDRNTFIVPKAVLLIGMSIGMITILLIPFDVANQGGEFGCGEVESVVCGDLSLFWTWQVAFLLIGIWILLLIPYTLFYYESFDFENDTSCKACASAIWSQVAITVVFVGVFIVCFVFLRFTELPVENFNATETEFIPCAGGSCEQAGIVIDSDDPSLSQGGDFIKIGTPVLVFLPGFLSFIGWFLFALYAGIGLVALPISLIRSCIYRPKIMDSRLYETNKKVIQKRTQELIEVGVKMLEDAQQAENSESIKDKVSLTAIRRRRGEKTLFNEFKQAVLELEEEYSDLKLCHENWIHYNPFVPWCKLILGTIGLIISLLWILQIILYNLARDPYGPEGVPTAYFLNNMFSAASKELNFTLIGTILIAVFTFYLLFCTMKGNEKFGLRFFIVEIHPIKWRGTYINSFLINLSLILFCVAPLVQFVASTLSEYVVLTELDAIFNQQVQFLRFFRIFYENNVFIIIILSVAFLTAFFMICFPNDKQVRQAKKIAKKIDQFKENAEKGVGGGGKSFKESSVREENQGAGDDQESNDKQLQQI